MDPTPIARLGYSSVLCLNINMSILLGFTKDKAFNPEGQVVRHGSVSDHGHQEHACVAGRLEVISAQQQPRSIYTVCCGCSPGSLLHAQEWIHSPVRLKTSVFNHIPFKLWLLCIFIKLNYGKKTCLGNLYFLI